MIIINRMYAGSYLEENIGHEVINTYISDNVNHYIYVNSKGWIDCSKGKVDAVLLVRLHSEHVFEVIGYASELECFVETDKAGRKDVIEKQREQILRDGITYGGIPLCDVFPRDEDVAYFTFLTRKYRAVKEGTKLYIADRNEKNETYSLNNITFAKQSLHMYVDGEDSSVIEGMIAYDGLWEDCDKSLKVNQETKDVMGRSCVQDGGIFEIIGQTYKEVALSNWIAYYLRYDSSFLRKFLNEFLNVKFDENCTCNVRREYKNTDIWIDTPDKIIIIENKIKAKIGKNQLEKYYEVGKKSKLACLACFLLVPDYYGSDEEIKKQEGYDKHYKILRYSELLELCQNNPSGLPYFNEFMEAVKKHASKYDNNAKEVMKNKLIMTIRDKWKDMDSK